MEVPPMPRPAAGGDGITAVLFPEGFQLSFIAGDQRFRRVSSGEPGGKQLSHGRSRGLCGLADDKRAFRRVQRAGCQVA